MKFKQNIIFILFLGLVLSLVFGGGVLAADKIEVTIAHPWTNVVAGGTFKEILDDFNNSQDEIFVKDLGGSDTNALSQKMMAGIVADTLPNIVWGQLPQLLNAEKIVYLDEFIDAPGGIERNDFYDSSLELFTDSKGRLVSMPIEVSNIAVWYNTDMMEEANLPMIPENYTWEDFESMAEKLTKREDGEIVQQGAELPIWEWAFGTNVWKNVLYQSGGEFYNEDLTKVIFDSPEGVRALDKWLNISEDKAVVPNLLSPFRENGIKNQNTAMYINGPWMVGYWIKELDLPLATAPMPQMDPDNKVVHGWGRGLSIIKASEEEVEASFKFLEFMLNRENQLAWSIATGYLPVRSDIEPTDRYQEYLAEIPQMKVFVEQLEYMRPEKDGLLLEAGNIQSLFGKELENAFYGQKSAEEALEDAAVRINKEVF